MKPYNMLLGAWLLAATADAQVLNPSPGHQTHIMYVGIGFDQALINPVVGYGRVVRLGTQRRRLLLSADISVPPTGNGFQNRRYRIGAHWNLIQTGRFFLPLKLESSLSYARNEAYRGLNYSSALSLTPMVSVGRWTIGAEGYYNHGWATRLTNQPTYVAQYPTARDGWYRNPSGTLRGGLALGYGLASCEVTLRGGYQRNGQFDTYLPPYYVTAGFVRRFGRVETR